MKLKLFLVALIVAHAGCPRAENGGSEVGSLEDLFGGYARITIVGDRVYRWPGEVIETIDLRDPRRPVLLGEAATGLGCFLYCSGIHAIGDTAYASSLGQVVQSTVPSSESPDWVSPYSFIGEAGFDPLSPNLVLAGGSALTGSADEIVVVDLTGAVPVAVSTVTEPVLAQAIVGTKAFFTNATNGLAVYDFEDPFAPLLVSRMTLAPADGWRVAPAAPYLGSSIAAASTADLFVLSFDPEAPGFMPPCRLNWFRIETSTGTSTLRDDTADEDFGGCTSVYAEGEFVFVGYAFQASDPEAGEGALVVFRADQNAGLVRTARVEVVPTPTDIVVDRERGLVIVSTIAGIHVYDLSELTRE